MLPPPTRREEALELLTSTLEKYWVDISQVFYHYSTAEQGGASSGTMDHAEFMHLVNDCQLLNERVTQREINLIFHAVNEGEAPTADKVRCAARRGASPARLRGNRRSITARTPGSAGTGARRRRTTPSLN